MKRGIPFLLTLLALAMLQVAAYGQSIDYQNADDDDQDDSAPASRVARISFMQGDVSFLRSGVTEWSSAVENLPLLSGDQIFVGRGARAEIQLGSGSYIRLTENTDLTISLLSDSEAQFEIAEGTAILQLERIVANLRRFEVDTPNSAIVITKDGLYRLDVNGEKQSELIVRGGEAEVSTDDGSFRVREAHRLQVDTGAQPRVELALDVDRDAWDQWSYDRDTTIARNDVAPDDVTSFETSGSDFYGVSDLSSYGTWTSYGSYGRCWVPRVASDWAPYRLGQWIWIPAAGWTWLSNEPWGWAPYHYGRWSYIGGIGWAWIPGFGRGFGYRDYHWRPALVAFYNWSTPGRSFVGWHPLAPGEHWHRPDHRHNDGGRSDARRPGDGRRRSHDGDFVMQPVLPGNGMTILPVESFNRGDRNSRPSAPKREQSGWLGKGARAGLPDLSPSPIAAAPVLNDNDRRRERRVAAPSSDVVRRPVLTRNPVLDNTEGIGKRERRVVSPPDGKAADGKPSIDLPGRGVRKDHNGGNDQSPVMRVPLPGQGSGDPEEVKRRTGNTDDNSGVVERKQKESNDNSGRGNGRIGIPNSEEKASPTDRQQLREQRRVEREKQQQGTPGSNNNSNQTRQERRLEKEQQKEPPRSDNNREQIRQERRQEKEQTRETPRSDNREQSRQERRQEKEQRQQSQDQKKKP